MEDYFLEPYSRKPDPYVWCKYCLNDSEINENCQVECLSCGKTYDWQKTIGEYE